MKHKLYLGEGQILAVITLRSHTLVCLKIMLDVETTYRIAQLPPPPICSLAEVHSWNLT